MAITQPIVLCEGILISIAPQTIYLTPAAGLITIRRAVFTNLLTQPATLTVTKTSNSSGTYILVNAQPISAGESYVPPALANLVMQAGDFLQASSSLPSAFNAFLSGFQSQ